MEAEQTNKPAEHSSWLTKCPVCKTRQLSQVDETKFFGLLRIQYVKCECGAAFWPRGDKYQLLEVTDKSLPVWHQYGNKEFTPKEWANIAHGESPTTTLAMAFDVRNLHAEDWFDTYTFEFAEPVARVMKDRLNTLFKQAMAEGWGIYETQSHLEQLFRECMEGDLTQEEFEWFEEWISPDRTEMIARTETIRASNKGSDALYKAWGVEYKEWWTTFDERTCPFCMEMHGIRIITGRIFEWKGKKLIKGEVMNVQVKRGNELITKTLKLDYEDITGPPLHPNCRCTLLPWKEEWAEWDAARAEKDQAE